MSIHRVLRSIDPEVETEHFEASELRKLSGELLRERRKLLAQLQQREQSCTELLSENFELKTLQSRLFSALDRAKIDVHEFLKEDERKVRMAEVDKQLEDELRQMHAVVGDQQKRLDALVLENERLREQLQAKDLPQPTDEPAKMPCEAFQEMPAEASLGAPPSPAAPEALEVPKPRPWPLRASVAPLRNAKALAEIRHVRLGVRLMPTALRSNGRAVEKLEVSLSLAEPAEAVLKLLLDAGLFWPRAASSLGPAQEGGLREGHFLLNGKALSLDLPLQDQGVQEGSELRLVKGRRAMGQLACQGVFAPRLPRGILMSAEPWEPRTSRKAAVDFFDKVNNVDMDHMAKITRIKRGQTKPFYKTEPV